MTNLRAIHASFNKIEHVSDSIKKFDKLQSLRLNDNCIAKMPNLNQVSLKQILRIVETQAILFLKSMPEKVGSDIQPI